MLCLLCTIKVDNVDRIYIISMDLSYIRQNPSSDTDESIGVFDFKRRFAECSVYDIKVPRERFESIRIRLLSYRSRDTLMSYTDHSAAPLQVEHT